MMSSDDRTFMEMAIELANQSRPEDVGVHPLVGVVVTKDGQVLGKGYRGEHKAGEHAEYTVLEKNIGRKSVVDAAVYTTLEPCTTRNHPKVPCAFRLAERGVTRVVIGMLDPNQNICGRGVRHLRKAGIATELFPAELMAEVEAQNQDFIRDQESKQERSILSGLGQRGSSYEFTAFADNKTKELYLVAQNLRTLLHRPDFLPHVKSLLAQGTRVTLVLTTFEAMSAINPVGAIHLRESVRNLRDFYFSLRSEKRRKLLRVHFHPAASSLSVQVRDPGIEGRALLVFAPKWATDTEPENRLYCVLDRGQHKDQFDKLYGSIPSMTQIDSLSLKQMCEKLDIPWET
jgi:pyrimidine deaminase RibD-like protein